MLWKVISIKNVFKYWDTNILLKKCQHRSVRWHALTKFPLLSYFYYRTGKLLWRIFKFWMLLHTNLGWCFLYSCSISWRSPAICARACCWNNHNSSNMETTCLLLLELATTYCLTGVSHLHHTLLHPTLKPIQL